MDLNDPNFGNTSNSPQNQNSQSFDFTNYQSSLFPHNYTINSQINPNAHNPSPPYYHNPQFYPNSQDQTNFQNVQVSQNISRNLFQENQEKQKKTRKKSTPNLWSVEEDIILMKSWCYYSCDEIKENNQKGDGLWARVMEMYEQYRREHPDKIGERNLDSMKGRHQRICKNVNMWVACYRKAYARKSSGMSMSDVKKDAHAGRSGKATIILEAVASYDLWIWHAFFGTPGSLNDINVLHRSPVFDDILEGRAPEVNYYVNGSQYNMGYYLTDGIYPSWASFVKSISTPVLQKHKLFAQHQEAVRKDVERAFGVLQARFAFIKKPSLVWDPNLMGKIIMTCIIMHNMTVEDERDTYLNQYDTSDFDGEDLDDDNSQPSTYSTQRIASLSTYMNNQSRLQNRETHNALKRDLIEHIWQKFGSGE